MKRKLAVPLAVSRVRDRTIRTRILKDTQDVEDIRILAELAENRRRLERLERDLQSGEEFYETEDILGELDYAKASIELGLLELRGELEELPVSEELFEEAFA